jgi:putative membrane protein|tara:strand:- start:1300 stop:1839 length:540 start_codon:yes stop_codon:yes gene_type:complete
MSKISDKLFFRIAMVVSIVVFVLVVLLNKRVLNPPLEFPDFIYRLPLLHAIINGTCAVLLILSLRAIKAKNVAKHKALNLTAFGLSALFLISYVIYHFFVPETTFGGEGPLRYIYYFILISHIILAAGVLPLILLSFWYALNEKIDKHRKIVRFTFPIWLYVAVTGVVVYLMISPYYSF